MTPFPLDRSSNNKKDYKSCTTKLAIILGSTVPNVIAID